MSGLEVVLAVAGVLVFILVVVGMILITPAGVVEGQAGTTDPTGPSPRRAP